MKRTLSQVCRRTLACLLACVMLAGCLDLPAFAADAGFGGASGPELKLWYDEPSSKTGTPGDQGAQVYNQDQNIWQQDTLPIGSGDLGANIYGEIATERVTLNEKTLWTQGPTEQDPNYNGGNIVANGRNGAALKEVETYFKEHPEATTVPGDMLKSFLGEWQGYGYYAPWGELDIAYEGMEQVTEVFAAKGTNIPVGEQRDEQYFNKEAFTFSGDWYVYNDGDGSHRGPGKVETSAANAYFTYSFTVPAGKEGTLELHADTSGGGGTMTLEFTQKPNGYNQAAVDAVASGGILKSFAGLVPGDYTVKGTLKSGKADLDYVRLACSVASGATNYQRWLTLDDALAGVRFTLDGVTYTREFLASNPDNVIAGKLTSENGSMNLTITALHY